MRLRLVARHGRRLRKRIRQPPLQSGIGLLRRTETRLAFHYVCPMLSQACSATPVASRWHTLRRQSAGSSFPFPASPMLSLRSGLSVALAYPKSSTMLIARQALHRPLNIRPHRLEKRKPKCAEKTSVALSVSRHTLAILPHIALHIPLGSRAISWFPP